MTNQPNDPFTMGLWALGVSMMSIQAEVTIDNKATNCSASNGPGDGDACAKRPSRMRCGQQVYQ